MDNNKRIMVVDDSRVITEGIKHVLVGAGYDVIVAHSGEEALDMIRKYGLPHLAIVDLQMPPRMNGFAFCQKVLQFSDLPIIILTASSDEALVVQGLQEYAEDYIVKPFRSAELVARIERVLRRIGDFAYTFSPVINVDERLQISFAERQAIIEGERIDLTPIEAKLLYVLMKSAGRVVPTEYLLRRVWPLDDAHDERLHAHIYRLRKKIERDPKEPRYVVSEWAQGYRFLPSSASHPSITS